MYTILGRYKLGGINEIIDSAETLEMAQNYAKEYSMAYGKDWIITIGKTK